MVELGGLSGRVGPIGQLVIGSRDGERQTSLKGADRVDLPSADYAGQEGVARVPAFSAAEGQFIDTADHSALRYVLRIYRPFGAPIELAILEHALPAVVLAEVGLGQLQRIADYFSGGVREEEREPACGLLFRAYQQKVGKVVAHVGVGH